MEQLVKILGEGCERMEKSQELQFHTISLYIEEQETELNEVAGTWSSASTFGSASTVGSSLTTASSAASSSSFG